MLVKVISNAISLNLKYIALLFILDSLVALDTFDHFFSWKHHPWFLRHINIQVFLLSFWPLKTSKISSANLSE